MTFAPTPFKHDDSPLTDQKSRSREQASRILLIPLVILIAALIRKAWLDLDTAWDSLEYHLPFAALRVGLLSLSDYHPCKLMMERYHGFPILPDLIQGTLWRVTTRVQAANLIGMIGLLSVASMLKLIFKVPMTYLFLGLLSVPMILIQSTSAYIDLFVNCWMAIMLLLILSAALYPQRFSTARLIGVFVSFAVVLNSKMQLIPVAGVALSAMAILLFVRRKQFTGLSLWNKSIGRSRKILFAGICFSLLCLSFANEIKNWIEFDDPIYPVPIVGGRVVVPSEINNKPDYLAHSPQFVRWIISTVEYKCFEGRNPLWTNGQGDVPLTSPAAFMGGNFGALVLFNILWLFFLQAKVKGRFGWTPLWFMGILTFLTAFLPGSAQSRYYLYWIICLIASNLVLIVQGLSGDPGKDARVLYLGGMASLLVFVLCATDFDYVRRNGEKPRVLVQEVGVRKRLLDAHLQQGETVCIVGKSPVTFMYAPMFNPQLSAKYHYHIQEAYNPTECRGARVLP